MVAIADMHHLRELHAQLTCCRRKGLGVGLRAAHLVREREGTEVVLECVHFQPLSQVAPGGDHSVGHDAKLVALRQLGKRPVHARDGVRCYGDFHFFVPRDNCRKVAVGQGTAQTVKQYLHALADGPGDVLVVPHVVERRFRHIVGKSDCFVGNRFMAVKCFPRQVPPLLVFRAKPFCCPLGFVRVIVDDRVPEVE